METIIHPDKKNWKALCQRPQIQSAFLEDRVKTILERVKSAGDKALQEITWEIDQVKVDQLRVSDDESKEAIQRVPSELKESIQLAAHNIKKFHAAQSLSFSKIETTTGVVCWRKAVPIQKVGIYIPGGSAPLFSTVLMLGIPATLAACNEIVLCTPPNAEGKIDTAILFTAHLVGIKNIFKIGGAQAIAAMAYGTESIPQVYKIFGPGNQYVTKAKQLVNMEGTAIDMPAGPSEVLVLADEFANPIFVAADLLSQAEHGADSQVMLVTSTEEYVKKVTREIEIQLQRLDRKEIAKKALVNSKAIILEKKLAIDFINEYAPEHLIINTQDCDELAEQIVNAGSIFLGQYSPESAGDYASGTNHTLPTNGFAKNYSGVSLENFYKFITFQKISKEGIHHLSSAIEIMAEAEQLKGHAEAVRVRTHSTI